MAKEGSGMSMLECDVARIANALESIAKSLAQMANPCYAAIAKAIAEHTEIAGPEDSKFWKSVVLMRKNAGY
jgi:hypothetical protein